MTDFMVIDVGRVDSASSLVKKDWVRFFIHTDRGIVLDINRPFKVLGLSTAPSGSSPVSLPSYIQGMRITCFRSVCGDDICILLQNGSVIVRELDFDHLTNESMPTLLFYKDSDYDGGSEKYFKDSDIVEFHPCSGEGAL